MRFVCAVCSDVITVPIEGAEDDGCVPVLESAGVPVEDGVFAINADGDDDAVLFDSGAVLTREMAETAASVGLRGLQQRARQRGAANEFVDGEFVRRVGELFKKVGLPGLSINREIMLANRGKMDDQDVAAWENWHPTGSGTDAMQDVRDVRGRQVQALRAEGDPMQGLQRLFDDDLPARLEALRVSRNKESEYARKIAAFGEVLVTCSLSKAGYVLGGNEPVRASSALQQRVLETQAHYDSGSYASFVSPELFDRFQELGWPILTGGRRVRLANGQVIDTPTRELLAEVSVTSSRTGKRHSAEVLLGELELMGDATITLGRDVTVQLHLDEWLESGVADARREMHATEFRKLQCLRRVWSVWRQRVCRQMQLWRSLARRRQRRAFRSWLHHAEAPTLVAYRRRQLQARFRSKVQQLGMGRMTDAALDRVGWCAGCA